MLLVIDNFDSFTHNLVQYFGQLGEEVQVHRNTLTPEAALALKPKRLLLSPGPCSPNEAGNTLAILKAFERVCPILGVCLGHQSIAQFYGGNIVRAPQLMHGKTSPVQHTGSGLFQNIPDPFEVVRYHSLTAQPSTLPACLQVTATTEDGTIMGIQHTSLPIHGVQFHPESYGTNGGMRILENFLAITD